VDVDFERRLPFLVADGTDFLEGRLMRGIVDEDIDPTQFIDGALNDRPAMLRIADIARD
jgi:hypothetical protein